MNVPQFTAESSLYTTTEHYSGLGSIRWYRKAGYQPGKAGALFEPAILIHNEGRNASIGKCVHRLLRAYCYDR